MEYFQTTAASIATKDQDVKHANDNEPVEDDKLSFQTVFPLDDEYTDDELDKFEFDKIVAEVVEKTTEALDSIDMPEEVVEIVVNAI